MNGLVLAFGFGTPALLWGVSLAGLPILIHLLYRRKYVEVSWAAMQFLVAATRKQARRLRIEQWLLLAARVLIIALAALACSRPTIETLGAVFQQGQPTQRVVVVDATPSMGYTDGQRSRFEQARDLARRLLEAGRPGDALHLLRISAVDPQVLVRGPAYATGPVLDELQQLQLFDDRGEVSTALEQTLGLLELAPEIRRKEVWFLTDLQAGAWLPQEADAAARIRRLLQQLAGRCQLHFVDVGQSAAANLAVTRFDSGAEVLLAGRPAPLTATVRNFSPAERTGVTVELLVNGRLVDTRRSDLPPAQEVALEFQPILGGGETRVEIRLPEDGLRLDDHRRLSFAVREEIRLLLVNGQPSGLPLENATDFLRLALDPSNGTSLGTSPFRPTVITEGELLSTDLSQYDGVFLCNVAQFTEREAEVLRRFAMAGGGVVFALGDQIRAESYNQVLGSGEAPLLPARLVERVGETGGSQVFEFAADEFEHPIVKPFEGNPGAGLELTRTFAYFKAALDDRGGRVALAFDDGDPAIVEKSLGRGRCILITTSLDRRWSTWAVWGHSFIPLMHETALFAVGGRWKDRSILAGQNFELESGTEGQSRTITVKSPDGQIQQLATGPGGENSLPAPRAGFYELQGGPPQNLTEWLAVNGDPRESDLATLQEEDLRTELLPGVNVTYHTALPERLGNSEAAVGPGARTGTGLARSLLLCVLALLLVEPFLAWSTSLGLLLLGGLAVATTTALLWSSLPGLALLLALASLAGGVWYLRRASTALATTPR